MSGGAGSAEAQRVFGTPGQAAGLEIWRIEKMEPKPVEKESYGQFYSGDSYIVLKTTKKASSFEWDIFFWLGAESSQDEQGAAALWTVELDDLLGGAPVQHREVQEHESAMFQSCFKSGIRYMDGGMESAFRHVERDTWATRLFLLKGKRNVRVSQVDLKASSLNHGDVFIVDAGLKIYQWNGKEANRMEKAKGLEVTVKIKDEERGGRAELIIVDDGQEPPEFWEALGGKGEPKSADEAGGDQDHEKAAAAALKLFKVSDASGSLEVTPVEARPLKREMLDTNDVFILDIGTEIFVWVGKGCTNDEKKSAMKIASTDFLVSQQRPAWTAVTRVVEGGETPLFKSKFALWPNPSQSKPVDFSRQHSTNQVAKAGRQASVADLGAKLAASRGEDDLAVSKDPNSPEKVDVWVVADFKKTEVDPKDHGQFYSGLNYLVLHEYQLRGRQEWFVYFWLGKDADKEQQGAAALLAKELDDSLGGRPVQMRVVQNKEPRSFLELFQDRMIVRTGTPGNVQRPCLLHVHGSTRFSTRAVQVEAKAAMLNSGDAFVLDGARLCVWFGNGCNADERAVASTLAKVVQSGEGCSQDVVEFEEGKEDDAFWAELGGKTEYASAKHLGDEPKEPRLFQLSNRLGTFDTEEIFNWSQSDLVDDDVMLLDAYNEVFVWVGSGSNETEKAMAMETVVEYIKAMSEVDGRSTDTTIIRIDAGNEPPMFTAHFLGWDSNQSQSSFEDPYEKRLKAMGSKGAGAAQPAFAEAAVARTSSFKEPVKTPTSPASGNVDESSDLGKQFAKRKTSIGSFQDPLLKKEQAAAANDGSELAGAFGKLKPSGAFVDPLEKRKQEAAAAAAGENELAAVFAKVRKQPPS